MTVGNMATLIGTFVAVLTIGWSVIWSLLRQYLDARFETSDVKIGSLETKMDTKLDALETKMDAKLDALEATIETKLDTGFKAMDVRFDTVEANHEALVRQMAENNRAVVQAITKLTEDQR